MRGGSDKEVPGWTGGRSSATMGTMTDASLALRVNAGFALRQASACPGGGCMHLPGQAFSLISS